MNEKPECSSKIEDAGYRLYDEKELEVPLQILYFREFDIPLRIIKEIIEKLLLTERVDYKPRKKRLSEKTLSPVSRQYWT